jgi:ribonuclease HI
MTLPTELVVHFDGLCEPVNPGGVACYGWVISYYEDGDGAWHTWACQSGFIEEGPKATNNVAEWCALGFALRHLLNDNWAGTKLTVYGDSQLVINQLLGEWNCNSDRLIQFRDRCLEYIEKLGFAKINRAKAGYIHDVHFEKTFKAIWIPREENKQADVLSNKAYEDHTGQKVVPRKVKCECGRECVRFMSRTAKNPNRLFIKCECGKFTWLT